MSDIVEKIANQLAQDALKAAELNNDDKIVDQVGEIIGATSSTTQEAYLTFIRVHRANRRANKYLAPKLTQNKENEI